MNYSQALDAFGAYLNAQSWAISHLDPEELAQFNEDLQRARKAMEVAWLEQKPTTERDQP